MILFCTADESAGVYLGDLGVRQPRGANGFAKQAQSWWSSRRYVSPWIHLFIWCDDFSRHSWSCQIPLTRLFSGKLSFDTSIYLCNHIHETVRSPVLQTNLLGPKFQSTIYNSYVFEHSLWICVFLGLSAPAYSDNPSMAYQVGQKRTCINTQVNLPFAYSDCILDFLTIVLPIPYVLRMKMPFGRRLAVIGIFLISSV
jgi:hypothetical protein